MHTYAVRVVDEVGCVYHGGDLGRVEWLHHTCLQARGRFHTNRERRRGSNRDLRGLFWNLGISMFNLTLFVFVIKQLLF